jgi:hypothetical protein
LQKSDNDLMFDDSTSSDASQLHQNLRTNLIHKNSVSDDSDKAHISDSKDNLNWYNRIKRGFMKMWYGDNKGPELQSKTTEAPKESNMSQLDFKLLDHDVHSTRRRRQFGDDEDDDEDAEVASGDDEPTPEEESASSPLENVPDSKYCECINFIFILFSILIYF